MLRAIPSPSNSSPAVQGSALPEAVSDLPVMMLTMEMTMTEWALFSHVNIFACITHNSTCDLVLLLPTLVYRAPREVM